MSAPPGWPPHVPPPSVDGWEDKAGEWLLDQCPADFRAYAAWRRHPLALAWIARRHIAGQVEVMRDAYRRVRVEVGEDLPPEALPEVLAALEAEGIRLVATERAARLVEESLRGITYVPRL